MLRRIANYLAQPETVVLLASGLFSLGVIYDGISNGIKDVRAQAFRNDMRITELEKDRQRLARIEQKVDDMVYYFGVPGRQ